MVNGYSKLTVKVRWNGNLSHSFIVQSRVRQGSCLSPSLFNVFIDFFIFELRKINVGCQIFNEFVGCLLYTDDIIHLSPSINGLQSMLDVCSVTSRSFFLNFNCSKSFCIKFGPLFKYDTSDMSLCGNKIAWADSIKYLGIIFISGKQLSTDDGDIKRKFYTACKCLFANCRNQQELLQLQLLKSYCLPIFTVLLL